ncbi:MAG: GAD-like domain-containing protein [Aliishimia sp.]
MSYRSEIDGQSGEQAIARALKEHGPLTNTQPVSEDVIRMYEGRVPNALLDVWDNYGIGDLGEGRLRLCMPGALRSAAQSLFRGDPEFTSDVHIVAYGAFGDLVIWSERHQFVFVSMVLSSVEAPILFNEGLRVSDDQAVINDLLLLHPQAMDTTDDAGQPMFADALEKYDKLPLMHIYGMQPAASFGRPINVANLAVVEAEDWLQEKLAGSTFSLDDVAGGRFGVRDIGPVLDDSGQPPAGDQ